MARSDRVQVTVAPLTRLALEHLARRTGLTPSTQAMVLLKQALERTAQTEEVQRAYRQRVATRNHAHWLEDTVNERAEQLGVEWYEAHREEAAAAGQ